MFLQRWDTDLFGDAPNFVENFLFQHVSIFFVAGVVGLGRGKQDLTETRAGREKLRHVICVPPVGTSGCHPRPTKTDGANETIEVMPALFDRERAYKAGPH